MFRDARNLDDGDILSADVCIAGSGPAGMSVALGLRGTGLDVLLLEGGGRERSAEQQNLYAGEATGVGQPELRNCRTRMFGGSSNCWGGWCRPLDAEDFEQREWVPRSGWPIVALAHRLADHLNSIS